MWDLRNMVQDSTFSLKNKDILKLQNNLIQFFKHTNTHTTHTETNYHEKETNKQK